MSRRMPAPVLSPRVFRHFAVVTVAVTACIAMFADGENREAIAGPIEQRIARNHELQAEADKLGKRRLGATGLQLREEGTAYLPFAENAPTGEQGSGAPSGGGPAIGPRLAQSGDDPRALAAGDAGVAMGADGPVKATTGKPVAAKGLAPKRPAREDVDALLQAAQQRAGAASR